MDKLANISFNWTQIGGCCELEDVVQLKNADADVFIKPTLDELVDQSKAILLCKNESTDCCEMSINLYPHYKIQAFSLVSNVNKIEIFQGGLKEYFRTLHGVSMDDFEDDGFESYRYDVEIEKSGVTALAIKFLNRSPEVCMLGIVLQIAPNPNGITTLVPNASSINVENVHSLLQNSSKMPASDKCKQFLELMTKANNVPSQIPTPASLELCKEQLGNIIQLQNANINGEDVKETSSIRDSVTLQNYIDKMEDRLNKRLTLMEERHMEKFDCIIKMLEKCSSQ